MFESVAVGVHGAVGLQGGVQADERTAAAQPAPARRPTARLRPAPGVGELRELAGRVAPVTLAADLLLPVGDRVPGLADLLPGRGLRRGSVIGVDGPMGAGVVSLTLALVAAASAAGSWVGFVGFGGGGGGRFGGGGGGRFGGSGGGGHGGCPSPVGSSSIGSPPVGRTPAGWSPAGWSSGGWSPIGWVAAAEAGLDLERVAVVADPGRQWPVVTGALLDALDIVVIRPPPPGSSLGGAGHVRLGDARRLTARARDRSAVLVVVGGGWPTGPDVRLTVTANQWTGIGEGHGVLTGRAVDVVVTGRGAAVRSRSATIPLTRAA
jgi:hypothetical protein